MTKSTAVKVGGFVICGVLLFAIGLFLIGNHNELFGSHFNVYTDFANVDTLQSGAKIRVSGMDAGEVSNIAIPKQPSGKFRLTLHVNRKFHNMIREDSVASIETEGMVGNKFVNIQKGTNGSPECTHGCTLPSQEPFELSDLLRQGQNLVKSAQGTIQNVQQHADNAIDNFAKVGSHTDGMILAIRGKVERIASNGANITNGISSLVSGVQNGRGTVGKLLTDEQMAKTVTTAIAQAKQTSTNIEEASAKAKSIVTQFQNENIPQGVHQTVANFQATSKAVRGAVTSFLTGPQTQNTADALRQTIDNAQRATRNLASDTEAIKHNFFLRGFFHRRGFYSLNHFNREEYAASDFVKHPTQRIWLSAENLFTTSANGAQQLTSEGRSEIDHAVSEVADDLPNNPVMIEGYSDTGTPAQQYLAASQRANDVRKYLESRYHLKPNLLGTIALENQPPREAGLRVWSGVCLSLVVSRD